MVKSGVVDAAVACGVELMSRVPMGSTTRDKSLGRPVNKRYWEHYEFTSQFEGAERIAEKWDITQHADGVSGGELAVAAPDGAAHGIDDDDLTFTHVRQRR